MKHDLPPSLLTGLTLTLLIINELAHFDGLCFWHVLVLGLAEALVVIAMYTIQREVVGFWGLFAYVTLMISILVRSYEQQLDDRRLFISQVQLLQLTLTLTAFISQVQLLQANLISYDALTDPFSASALEKWMNTRDSVTIELNDTSNNTQLQFSGAAAAGVRQPGNPVFLNSVIKARDLKLGEQVAAGANGRVTRPAPDLSLVLIDVCCRF